MKRLTNRKFRLNFVVILYDKDGNVMIESRKRIKQKIVEILSSSQWSKAFIRVDYGNGMDNCSDHTTLGSALLALNRYTEKKMLDFVAGAI